METRGDDLDTETQADEEWAEGLYEDVADEAPEHSQSAAGSSGDTDELPDERHIAD